MKKHSKLLFAILFLCGFSFISSAQKERLQELKDLRKEKRAAQKALNEEIDSLSKVIQSFPGWKTGLSGIVGVDFTGSRNWFVNAIENNDSRAYSTSFNAFANYDRKKIFSRNSLNAAVQVQRVKNTDIDDNTGLEAETTRLISTSSNFSISSLNGYKYSKEFALSLEAAFQTGILNIDEEKEKIVSIFNNPGQLTASLGSSWTPNSDFYLSVHPIGVQWNYPNDEFSSSVGAKLSSGYNGELFNFLDWTSDLRAFIAYQGDESQGYSANDLSTWNWTNTFTIADLVGGIGLGFTLGLQRNKQLAFNKNVEDAGKLQSYYAIGLSYAIGG
ncbi:MAG: DUF3078 domain-containing protein [Bacteroidota bacterium]